MVYLNGVKNLTFKGCHFTNLRVGDPTGVGIQCNSSSLVVDGVCTSQQIPCTIFSPSVFSKLQYGIKAVNVTSTSSIRVNNSLFDMNIMGMQLSSCNYADILNTSFIVPEFYVPSGIVPVGLYLDNSTGYHVEANTFSCPGLNSSGNIGLYTYNSGGSQNYIYRNTFTNLSRGAVADGFNRVSDGTTGLCYKCNDFASNLTDIDIVRNTNYPLYVTDGIRKNQGMPFFVGCLKPDTLAAANVFSAQALWSIRNIDNPSLYYHHTQTIPGNLKVIPYPKSSTITNFTVPNTTYNKAMICKTWINTGGIPQSKLIDDKDEARVQAETTQAQLENIIDGGNTTNLTMEILGSAPSEALILRDDLIQKSPYLSDTVMKTAIENENVLPNTMIRDILVVNPQSAKSDGIMNTLDQRWEPMPDYMLEEIEAGKTIIGGKEQLEAVRDSWIQQESYLLNQIVGNYLNDTINPLAVSELKEYLQTENSIDANFTLTQLNIRQGDYQAAIDVLNVLQGNASLDADQQLVVSDYLLLINELSSLKADTIALFQVDSAHAVPLFALYNSGDNEATVFARNILVASGLLRYDVPINGCDSAKSTEVLIPVSKIRKSNRQGNELLNIYPNPANSYIIVDYNLPGNSNKAVLMIRNSGGIVVAEQSLSKVRDQVVFDTKSLPSGSYIISLKVNGKNICSKQLSVIK